MGESEFAGHAPGTRPYRGLQIGLFFAGVATFAQLYAPQAVLPALADDLSVAPATAALAVSAATLGLALAVIPWSLVADRYGRVPAMAAGIIAATLFGAVAPLSSDISLFFVLRFLEGIGLGAVPAVAVTYLSEEINRRYTATAAGSYIAGTTVGGLAGRLITGPVSDFTSWQTGVWATIGVCVASAVLFLWLVPRAQGFTPRRGEKFLGRLLVPLRCPRQWAIYAQGFLLMGAFVAVYNYLGFHVITPPLNLPVWLASGLFLAYLAGTFSSPWAGALVTRYGRYRVLLGAVALTTLGAALLFVPVFATILTGLVLFTAGFFGAHTVAAGWAPEDATQARAQASSLYYFGYYAGSSIFGWSLGYVFGHAGWSWFVVAIMGMCVLAALLAVWLLRPMRRN